MRCLILVAILATTSSANATLLISDNFNYPDGGLVGKNPTVGGTWTAHSGTGSVPIQVGGGKITLVQGGSTREDVNSSLQGNISLGAGGKLYASFDLTVANPGVSISSSYFAHFLDGTDNFASRISITAPTTSGYQLVLSNNNSANATGVARTGDLLFGTTYTIVTTYDYDSAKGVMWINPTLETDPSLSATDTPYPSMTIDGYAFRQGAGNTTQVIDNVRVGTTFSDVVPEPACLGLLGMGAWLTGRRRRAL